MEYKVRHRTTYRYLQDVSHSWHLAHLRLRQTPHQLVHESRISFSLEPASRAQRNDYFDNPCEWFSIDEPHTHLDVIAESHVRVDPLPGRSSRDSLTWEEVRRLLEAPSLDEAREAVQFIFDSPLTKFKSNIAGYAEVSFPPGRPLLTGAIELMNRIHRISAPTPPSPTPPRRWTGCSRSAPASARIWRMWGSRPCAAWACRRAMCRAIC